MLTDNCSFIGVGQAGGNICREFALNDNKCFFINTSIEDLQSLGSEDYDIQYHIDGTKGMGKSRPEAKAVITKDAQADIIAESIYKKYVNSKIYFFVYSLSGGTGGGMTHDIMRSMKELYPDKTINAIVARPHGEEDMIMQSNAVECLKELHALYKEGIVTNIQILDNNKKDSHKKMIINKTIASLMDTILSFESLSKDGNLDAQEIENLFRVKGLTTIHGFSNSDFLGEIAEVEKNTIYAKVFKTCTMQGLILNKENNNSATKEIIRDTFGIANISHETTWDEEENIIISTGIDFTEDVLKVIVKPMYDSYNELREKKKKMEEEMKAQFKENDINLDDMVFEEVPSVSTTTTTPKRQSRRRGRGVGLKAEMERYS